MQSPNKILALCHPKEIKLYKLFGLNITGEITGNKRMHEHIMEKALNESDRIELVKAYDALCDPISESVYRCFGQDGLNSMLINIEIDWKVVDNYILKFKTCLRTGYESEDNIIFATFNISSERRTKFRNKTAESSSVGNETGISSITTTSSSQTSENSDKLERKSQTRNRIRHRFWQEIDYSGTHKPIKMIKFDYVKRENVAKAVVLWDSGHNTQVRMDDMLKGKTDLIKQWLEQCKRWEKKEFEKYCPNIYNSLACGKTLRM